MSGANGPWALTAKSKDRFTATADFTAVQQHNHSNGYAFYEYS
jgi:hypothetical protein